MQERSTAVPAVYLIMKRGSTVLLLRRKNTGYYDGWYELPAGHVDAGELPIDAVVREAHEELGITVYKHDVTLAHVMYRTKHDVTGDRADYFFMVHQWQGVPRINEPEKCNDLRYCSPLTLPENTVHHVAEALRFISRGVLYSELSPDQMPIDLHLLRTVK